jgi:hypothetical protein
MQYCRFIAAIKKLNINLDRRAFSELAIRDPEAFNLIVERAKVAILAQFLQNIPQVIASFIFCILWRVPLA